MGRQINFYMNEQTKKDFLQFICDEGYVFIADRISEEPENLWYVEKEETNQFFSICLYKSDFGKIIQTKLSTSKNYYIDKRHNPIIEYRFSFLKQQEKEVIEGRLWLTSDTLSDPNADRTVINKSYNRLVRWIKKEVPYQLVNGHTIKRYISNSLVDLVHKDGYTLR